jgi:secretion/DNA translocation related TadE-like protein
MTTGRRPGPAGRQGQHGSASLLVVTLSGVVLLLGLAAAFVTATAAAHRRAQSAADLAALAGAVAQQRGDDACSGAADVARGNEAELLACEVLGEDVRVTVRVSSPELAGHTWEVQGRARAGPDP